VVINVIVESLDLLSYCGKTSSIKKVCRPNCK